MKKPPKTKRVPPRRKPLGKDKKAMKGVVRAMTQEDLDHDQAYEMAVRESLAPEILTEYLALEQAFNGEEGLTLEQDDRLGEILDQHPVSPETVARHMEAIRAEREASS